MKVDKDNHVPLLTAFVRSWLHDRLPGSKRPPVCRSVSGAAFLIAALLTLRLANGVSAQTPQAPLPIPFAFTVNSTTDAGDSVINGVCETSPGNGECTLRAAIQESNAHSGVDFINFNLPAPSTISLNSALPPINRWGQHHWSRRRKADSDSRHQQQHKVSHLQNYHYGDS